MRKTVVAIAALLFATIPTVASAQPARASGSAPGACRQLHVPVDVAGLPDAQLYGELCLPDSPRPKSVQLLVHGTTYTTDYWDWPRPAGRHSQVRGALDAGYATFNVDRLGAGQSSRPHSSLVTLDATIDTLHQIVAKLRRGTLGGHAFERVVYFGHSLSSAYGWVLAERHPADIDAFVLTGLIHLTRTEWLGHVFEDMHPACQDPKFAASGIDCGYWTTRPGARHFMYHLPGADPDVVALDEELKDVDSLTLIQQTAPLPQPVPPGSSPSRAITAPTLLVIGDRDPTTCGPPDGIDCTEEALLAHERPYYPLAVRLDAIVEPATGHALPLHKSGPRSRAAILDWLDRHVGP